MMQGKFIKTFCAEKIYEKYLLIVEAILKLDSMSMSVKVDSLLFFICLETINASAKSSQTTRSTLISLNSQ